MRYNVVWNNRRDPSSANPCFQPSGDCQGITGLYIDNGRDVQNGGMSYIYNNVVHDNDIGIQVWDSAGARVFNNVVYHNGFTPGAGSFNGNVGIGITVNWVNTTDVQVYNNTIYDNHLVGLYFGSGAPGDQV